MNLNQYKLAERAEVGADVAIVDPYSNEPLKQDDGSAVVIRVLGKDSAAFRKKEHELTARSSNRYIRRKGKDVTADDLDVAERDKSELLAAITTGWSGIDLGNGPVEFSQNAARDLYNEHTWIRDQVDIFVGDRANFFTKP